MNDISTLHSYRCDLNCGPCEAELRAPLMHQDALADTFRVEVYRGDNSINLSGMTAHGYLHFPAIQHTLTLNGTISGNSASVTFDDDCYALPGLCSLAIQLVNGAMRHTVLKVDCIVKRTATENVYFPANSPTLAELMARLEELETSGGSNSDGTEAVPAYWLTHLQSRVTRIREAMSAAGWNKSAFLFYSDAHLGYNYGSSPALLKYLYKNTPINKVIFGGDIINTEGEVASTLDYLWEWRAALRGLEHHSVPGNHDDGNDPDNRWTDADVYTFLLAAEESPYVMRGDALYYYIDEPVEKTRYLYLDTATKDGAIAWNDAQKTWLKEVLISTPDNWHVVAAAHIWAIPDYSVTPPTAGELGESALYMLDVFDKYNAREGDFSNCGARVEFCVGGHNHRDSDYTSANGIPVILVETDSMHVRSGLTCIKGTTSENSVNAIIADYACGVVNVIRIGRGVSRIVNLDGSGSSYDDSEDSSDAEDTTWMTTCITRTLQTSNDTVAIEWADNVDGVTYIVYDGDTEVARVTDHTQAVLFNVSAGEHVYSVRPQKSDNEVGTSSDSVTLTTVEDVGFTNMLRIATNEDGSLYNGGYGYKENTRYSSSSGSEVHAEGWDRSGIFPAKAGDVVRFYDMDFLDVDGSGGEWPRNSIEGYNEDYSYITSVTGESLDASGDETWALVRDADRDIIQFTMVSSWNSVADGDIVAKLRVNARNIDAFSIITVNEVINS